jgi:hypothetical protein
VDSTTAAFFTRLDELATNPKQSVDFGAWLQYYVFDVIGELTFSNRLGFLERGSDVEGVIESIAWNFDKNSVLGQMPWLDLVTHKNPIYLKFMAAPIASPILAFGDRRMLERLNPDDTKLEEETPDIVVTDPELQAKAGKSSELAKHDFLSRFLDSKEAHPEVSTRSKSLPICSYVFLPSFLSYHQHSA